MSTIVGTNIEVTNLKYDSDTTSMIISNTGQVTIQGEGTNTTNLQQGLCKAWAINDHTATSVSDSFNQSSITDTSTGTLTWDVTNNFASVNWTAAANTTADNADNSYSMVHSGTRTTNNTATDKDTTGTSWYAKNSSHSGYDSKLSGYIAQGDLA
tara:strand:+ start:423 stop:887 length:465 start_codon:yes stop_codon:yes gene_type:complete